MDHFYIYRNYPDSLRIIKGINFTEREIDTIACIISGRGRQATANILLIKSKTIETHTRNIMAKLNCNSRERVREIIELSENFNLIKDHYNYLLLREAFNKKLGMIKALNNKSWQECILVYGNNDEFLSAFKDMWTYACDFMNGRKKTFKLADTSKHIKNPDYKKSTIYLNPTNFSKVGNDQTASKELIRKINNTENKVIILPFGNEDFLRNLNDQNALISINPQKPEEYYRAFFKVMGRILQGSNLDELANEFEKIYKHLLTKNILEFTYSTQSKLSKSFSKHIVINLMNKLFKNYKLLILLALIILLIIIAPFSKYKDYLGFRVVKTASFKYDLPLPKNDVLLQRERLISEIDDKFTNNTNNKDIPSVALIGIGGAGKTTLARIYAQKHPRFYEINAETKEKLINSYIELAYVLAQTKKEKENLKLIQENKEAEIKEKQFKGFVEGRLKEKGDWLLIFDNVQDINTIKDYLPQNPRIWGNGKVLITTRDANIEHSNNINSVLFIKELTPDEKSTLFIKIKDNKSVKRMTSSQEEKTKKFLNSIPSFPLDVSIAASYIKATNIPYEKYLGYLNEGSKEFEAIQQSVLKDLGEEAKTRYSIIALSLNKLITACSDFKDLALFMSLLDSQDIPRSLLDMYANDVTVGNFIVHLKKYSLITSDSSTTFSIHRTIQPIVKEYLTRKIINEIELRETLISIAKKLTEHIQNINDNKPSRNVNFLIKHIKSFSTYFSYNPNLLPVETDGLIGYALGCMYFKCGDCTQAAETLKNTLNKLEKHSEDISLILKIKTALGETYRLLGEYKKAKEILKQSQDLCKKLPHNIIGEAQVLKHLGKLHKNLGEHKKAEIFLKESLFKYEKYSHKYPTEIASIKASLGNVYRELDKCQEAESILKESLKYYHEDNELKAKTYGRLANVYRTQGKYQEAIKSFEKSLKMFRNNSFEDHPEIAWVKAHLGNVYREIGKYEKALDYFEQSLASYRKNFPENYIKIAWVNIYLSNAYRDLGIYEKAKTLAQKSFDVYSRNYSKDDNLEYNYASAHLAAVELYQGEYQKARNELNKNLSVYKEHFRDNHYRVVWVQTHLGIAIARLKDFNTGIKLLEGCLKNYNRRYGENHVLTARILRNLGHVYQLKNQLQTAEDFFKKALEIFRQNNHLEQCLVLEDLAEVYLKKSEDEETKGHLKQSKIFKQQADNFLKQAFDVVKRDFPPNSAHASRIESKFKDHHNWLYSHYEIFVVFLRDMLVRFKEVMLRKLGFITIKDESVLNQEV